MSLEQIAEKYHELKQKRKNAQEERADQIRETERSSDVRIGKIDEDIKSIVFDDNEVKRYLISQGFERVDSLPWYLDVTRGVTRRLKDSLTYWRETETAEGKKNGFIFRVTNGHYELQSSKNNQRNSNVLNSDRRRFDEHRGQLILCFGSMFLGLGLGVGGYATRNPTMFLGGCAGLAYYAYIPLKICSFAKKKPKTEAVGNEAVLQLYQKFSSNSYRAPLSK